MTSFKIDGKLHRIADKKIVATHECLIHIVEVPYDASFTAWFGSVQLTTTQEEWMALYRSLGGSLELSDGRRGFVTFMGGMFAETHVCIHDEGPIDFQQLRFVGTTTLQVPEARKQSA